MAIHFTKEYIEYEEKVKHLKETSREAKKLCQVLEDFFAGKTTRSQVNKAIKKVKILTEEDEKLWGRQINF